MTTKFIIAIIIALTIGLLVGSRIIARPAPKATSSAESPPPASTGVPAAIGPSPAALKVSSTFCTVPPVVSDIGSSDYPVDPKYSPLGYLGQLFTAADCGPERVQKIIGVVGNRYTLGSALFLKGDTPVPLAQALDRAGFRCADKNAGPVCRAWTLSDDVPLSTLLPLREAIVRFINFIERDDCVNCG